MHCTLDSISDPALQNTQPAAILKPYFLSKKKDLVGKFLGKLSSSILVTLLQYFWH